MSVYKYISIYKEALGLLVLCKKTKLRIRKDKLEVEDRKE